MDIAKKFAPIGGGPWVVLAHQIEGAVDTSGLSGPHRVEFSSQVVQKARTLRSFLGCTEYPDCKNTEDL